MNEYTLLLLGTIGVAVVAYIVLGGQNNSKDGVASTLGTTNIVIIAAGFFLSLISIIQFGLTGIAIVISICVAYFIYIQLGSDSNYEMIVYTVADKIGEVQRYYGIPMNLRRDNISGQEVASLNLILVYFHDKNWTFFYNTKTKQIVGPKNGSLKTSLNELSQEYKLFEREKAENGAVQAHIVPPQEQPQNTIE